jgi:hypothetical protein
VGTSGSVDNVLMIDTIELQKAFVPNLYMIEMSH